MYTRHLVQTPEQLAERVGATPLPESLFELLVQTAALHGEKLALEFIDDDLTLTWAQLLDKVQAAAVALASIGVKEHSHVAVMAFNRCEFFVSWLALAQLGAVMVPVNATYISREVDYALTTSDATFLIIEDVLLPIYRGILSAPLENQQLVVLGQSDHPDTRQWDALINATEGQTISSLPADRNRVLNIQYTSGTTGFSKGCLLTHEYWLILGATSNAIFADHYERLYLGSSFYYMVGQRILVNAMYFGASVVVPRRPGAKRFMRDVSTYGCDYCALFEMVYKQKPDPSDGVNVLKLATIFAFAPKNHSDFQERFNVLGQEFYGMTEIGAALYVPVDQILRTTGTATVGVATPFREVMLADDDGQPTAVGGVGEICVRGPGMLLGYYRNPEATEQVFRDGWFRTGDLARVDEQGFYYILGRTKDMIRRNGENIAAREVEAVLRTLPQIKDVAVVPVPDDYRGEEIKAYLQPADGLDPSLISLDDVFRHCESHLAAFKIPRYIEFRDAFELTDSQRVKKKLLILEKPDLRVGSYDRMDKQWH